MQYIVKTSETSGYNETNIINKVIGSDMRNLTLIIFNKKIKKNNKGVARRLATGY